VPPRQGLTESLRHRFANPLSLIFETAPFIDTKETKRLHQYKIILTQSRQERQGKLPVVSWDERVLWQ
jgi:hypothetical protein